MMTKAFSPRPTHAGGIVFKIENTIAMYLLIRPKNRQNEWVFPKGHIEPGESETQAAVREVTEETGVVAKISSPVGTVEFRTARERVRAAFYLMEFMTIGAARESRGLKWAPVAEALRLLTHDSNRDLLKTAEMTRIKLAP